MFGLSFNFPFILFYLHKSKHCFYCMCTARFKVQVPPWLITPIALNKKPESDLATKNVFNNFQELIEIITNIIQIITFFVIYVKKNGGNYLVFKFVTKF